MSKNFELDIDKFYIIFFSLIFAACINALVGYNLPHIKKSKAPGHYYRQMLEKGIK